MTLIAYNLIADRVNFLILETTPVGIMVNFSKSAKLYYSNRDEFYPRVYCDFIGLE